jgi:orotidine-5'-phosphate decarboxylase
LHDIPETVARAVTSAMSLGAELMTLHTAGGLAMMKRAAEAAQGRAKLLGVTVLTSLAEDDLHADGIGGSMREAVVRRAQLAVKAGIAGIVCSPQEVADVRAACPSLLLVVPGVRPAGADYLVVGRPIRDASSPAAAFTAVVNEVTTALAGQ